MDYETKETLGVILCGDPVHGVRQYIELRHRGQIEKAIELVKADRDNNMRLFLPVQEYTTAFDEEV